LKCQDAFHETNSSNVATASARSNGWWRKRRFTITSTHCCLALRVPQVTYSWPDGRTFYNTKIDNDVKHTFTKMWTMFG
jgi:hypothetical protein